jgi:16S rRNA (cytosine967-C5)-methyltransferase
VTIIERVESGEFLDETIDHFFAGDHLTTEQKSLIYEMVSGVVRWKGYLAWILEQYAKKDVKKPVRYLIWATLYQVTFMKKAAHHVVKEAVDYAKVEHDIPVAGFVNAILRRFLRDIEHGKVPLPGGTGPMGSVSRDQMAAVYSFPEWIINRWISRLGSTETEALLRVLNRPPEFTLRVNDKHITRDEAIQGLENLGLKTRPGSFLESALHVDRLAPLIHDDLLVNNRLSVQDEASQLAVHALQVKPGSLVWDACSGLGTKASHIMDLTGEILLVAMDNSMNRLRFVDRRAHVVQADVFHAPFRKDIFDAILVDAPCSSLGIIRKHPEIKWRRREKEIAKFGAQQYAILESVWDKLKVGGYLVYSVCSFEPEETVDIIDKFKADRKFALENPLPFLFNKEYFVSLPHKTGIDGFFIARLKKL